MKQRLRDYQYRNKKGWSSFMPLFGAHLSIAGGYHLALTAAVERTFDTVQLFTKNLPI